MQEYNKYRRFHYLYVLPCFFVFTSALITLTAVFTNGKASGIHFRRRNLLQVGNETECIPSGIYSFPDDFFTQEERQKGGIIVHLIILIYACAMIASICDVYFIPSLEIISEKLKLPPDVAGATFMAIGASSPELFSSIFGSFVTEGDIGIGAVIGSAVFNILGITGVAGIALWNEVLDIDWYPMVRDCIAYSITVICLICIIYDNKVTWWESVILLVIFVLYIVLMYFNSKVEKCTRNLVNKVGPKMCCCAHCVKPEEKSPLLKQSSFVPEEVRKPQEKPSITKGNDVNVTIPEAKVKDDKREGGPSVKAYIEETEEHEDEVSLCSPPKSGVCSFLWWLIMLPATLLFFFTVPNCSYPRCRKFFPLTFVMSVAWLGALSYIAVWMVTIIGYTLSIPDSVSGLTILAIGASVPDLISSVLVAKSGQGNMAISNLVGSNNFDISICLGIPWLGKSLISPEGFLRINSSALSYATGALFITLIIFFMIFHLSHWKLNRTVGFLCMLVYALFVVLASLFEFNVFGEINLPTCYP